ncbi:MAG: preprotein translocase subunit SecE, partial [Spirochaetaceae bacterium]|nr:preprotein translocase subunit SecE [Spirochaetaceae bacterium]
VWPSWDNVKKSAKVVIVSTIIFALFFGALDFLFTQGLILLF